jgi:glutamate N-acetyltransferase/amino-acid N-acetyltransferase
MKKFKGGITAPKGFKAAGIACGIKKSGKPDLALIYSEIPATAAAVFTTNQVKGAPVIVSQKHIKKGEVQAVISNSGNANTWTGKKGIKDAWQMAAETARALGIPPRRVLVTSTGVIGKPLPMNKIKPGIRRATRKLSKAGGKAAARAILTTDTRTKEIAVKVGNVSIGGMAKGAGMISPGMATMHAFITTDAKIDNCLLQKILKNAASKTFNMVSVDSCMSTSDCVMVLANGLSKSKAQSSKSEFVKAFEYVCEYLAKEIARDGEGATKLLTVKAIGARHEKDAKAVVKALIGSFLLKAASYGRDKNIGRILQAVGTTSAKVNWKKFKFDWQIGIKEDIITANLGVGKSSAVGWGCDLTEGYVKINAKYRT